MLNRQKIKKIFTNTTFVISLILLLSSIAYVPCLYLFNVCSIECNKEREKVHYFYFICHIKFMYDSAHGILNVRSYFKNHFNYIAIAQRLLKITNRDLTPISNISTLHKRSLYLHAIRVIPVCSKMGILDFS